MQKSNLRNRMAELGFRGTAQLLLVVLFALLLSCATGNDADDYSDLDYRDSRGHKGSENGKTLRDNGLGSLLLKNLRFRDLGDRETLSPGFLAYVARQAARAGRKTGISKKSSTRLEQLLQDYGLNLRRDADGDGVRLQSLRFGK